jgi:hypothetical protein
MPFTHQKTVTVTPADDAYAWTKSGDDSGNWITISNAQDSNGNDTDTWDFLVADNGTNSTRTATCTLTHSNGTTTDSFLVTQYATGGSSTTSSSTTQAPVSNWTVNTGTSGNVYDTGFTMSATLSQANPGTDNNTERGFEWGTNQNNLDQTHINGLVGVMAFNHTLTGLTPETTYYYRAYSKSPVEGTTYGSIVSFTTLAAVLSFTSFYTEVGSGSNNLTTGDTVDEAPFLQRIYFRMGASQDITGYKIAPVSFTKISPNAGAAEGADFNGTNSSLIDNNANLTGDFTFSGNSASGYIAIAEDNKTEGNETYRLTISADYTDANGAVLGQHGYPVNMDFIINDNSVYAATIIENGVGSVNTFSGPTSSTSGSVELSSYAFDNNPSIQGPTQIVLVNAYLDNDPQFVNAGTSVPNTVYWSNNADGSTNDSSSIQGDVVHNTAIDANAVSGGWNCSITFEDGSGSAQATTQAPSF